MSRLNLAVLLAGLSMLVPATARADDGGIIDFLERWSGPKFVGVSTDIHILCLDKSNRPVRCEEWFMIPHLLHRDEPVEAIAVDQITHEFDFRFAWYKKYGDRFSDDPVDSRSINALKLMVMYHYHPDARFGIGFGVGYMPVFGEGFDVLSRGVLTPFSVIWGPFTRGNAWQKAFVVRAEESYLTQGLNGASFGNTVTAFSTSGEWNFSVGAGFDFRRRWIK
jgi:hypothetical protein